MAHTSFNVPVFFVPDMVAHTNSYSPSSGKPEAVVRDWLSAQLPIDVRGFLPVTREQLYRVHDRAYVDGVLDLRLSNGFGNRSPQVARSLPYTSGAMLTAAREAIANGSVGVAPVSGFHHAGYHDGSGFCTFNGLMAAAAALIQEDGVSRVAILDCDYHYGNGTDDILELLPAAVRTRVKHFTTGRRYTDADQARDFLSDVLPNWLSSIRDAQVLLYQAGADAHIDDPLGGWMTTAQLQERDRIVFDWAATNKVPVAWDLAGGYQKDEGGGMEPVLRIHRNTMQACAACFAGH